MATATKIKIVGIGDDGLEGLTTTARQLVAGAELLVGPENLLSLARDHRGQRFVVGSDLDEVVRRLASASEAQIVVLVSGDPLFYGLARYLCDQLGKERFDVVPHVSSMQLAFARVKESWEEAYLTNLASHGLASILDKIRLATKVGLFTTPECGPQHIARELLSQGIDYFTAYVCENLGSPDERVTHGELSDIADDDFGALNVMILIRKPNVPDRPSTAVGRRLFGNPDDMFLQSKPKKGLLTPAEVRSLALAELDLGPRSTVWDIGAGSGSVAIEAAQIAREGTTYAIEMEPEDHILIRENAERFRVTNLVPVLGRAPEAWEALPAPDAIFVGGSGRDISRLVDMAYDRLRSGGRLVATVAHIESLADVHAALQKRVQHVNVWMLNLARGTYQMERIRFEALNPTFLLAVVKPE